MKPPNHPKTNFNMSSCEVCTKHRPRHLAGPTTPCIRCGLEWHPHCIRHSHDPGAMVCTGCTKHTISGRICPTGVVLARHTEDVVGRRVGNLDYWQASAGRICTRGEWGGEFGRVTRRSAGKIIIQWCDTRTHP